MVKRHLKLRQALALLLLLPVVALRAHAATFPDFTELVRKTGAAVVNIGTTQAVADREEESPFALPDQPGENPYGDFFEYFFGQQQDEEDGMFGAESLGSGFVIDAEGYILTNRHVVEDAQEIIVRLSDRRELPAVIVGSDPRTDIALLKVQASALPVVTVGRSADLQVGEWVLAIGSPFGFEQSVTAGIVSAKGRSLPRETYVPFIQTDVAINPGNSGGPLFNMKGEVVGINSQIYSRTGGYMGLSFAIPIELAMEVAEQLKVKGHVSRGWLGVLIQEVNRELAESFQMSKPQGALVTKVFPEGPSMAAGLRPGDVIVELAGRPVERASALPPLVAPRVGERVPVEVIRDGKPLTLEVAIAELPEDQVRPVVREPAAAASADRVGLVVSKVPAEVREAMGFAADEGVLVEGAEGAAATAGIEEGDVILIVNGERVTGTKSFERIVASLPTGQPVPMLVQRPDSGREFLALRVPQS